MRFFFLTFLVSLTTIALGVGLTLLPQWAVVPVAVAIAIAIVPLRRWFIAAPLLLLALAALPIGSAHAAEGVLDSVRPALADVAIVLIVAAVSWAAQRFSALTGIQIEARHREALQSALANAARIAVDAGTDAALGYIRRSVPDAIAHFKIASDTGLKELLEPHVARLAPGGGK